MVRMLECAGASVCVCVCVCVCVRACVRACVRVYAFRIVSMDKILRFTNSFNYHYRNDQSVKIKA